MATTLLGNPFFDGLAAEHRTWLSAFDARYLVNWERMLNANEESALAEAGVRRLLQAYGVRVEPNEDLTGGETGAKPRPDFRCESNGSDFEVEVTHISIEKATKVTGLVEGQTGPRTYRSLNDANLTATGCYMNIGKKSIIRLRSG